MPDRGIVYIATGERYVQEATVSAQSLKRHAPHLHVTLYSDVEVPSSVFDRVVGIPPEQTPLRKITHAAASPYDRSLYLDSDTYVLQDISDVFDLLDRFDVAAAQAPLRYTMRIQGVPDSFPEYNAGVVAYRKCEPVRQFFDQWRTLYSRMQTDDSGVQQYYQEKLNKRCVPDQPAFRMALYASSLRVATLAPEYNCRAKFPGVLHGPVRILHARFPDLEQVASVLNSIETRRCFTGSYLLARTGGGRLELRRYGVPRSSDNRG